MLRPLLGRALLLLLVVSGTALAQKRGDRSLITRADLNEAGGALTTAFDAVQRLRPLWLRPPSGRVGSSSMNDPTVDRNAETREVIVYLDEVRQPNLEALRAVATLRIVEVKYLDQNRAVQLLGPGNEAGAILVTTVDKR